jgi:hypothetical protein
MRQFVVLFVAANLLPESIQSDIQTQNQRRTVAK